MRTAALLVLVATILVPSALAGVSGSSQLATDVLAYDGPTTITVTVTVGCDLALTTGGGTATLSMDALPSWLTAAPTTVDVDPVACVPGVQGNITQQAAITVTPAADAPGLRPTHLNATVAYKGKLQGEETAEIPIGPVVVAYRPGHKITPEGDQTFTVPSSEQYSLDMSIEVTANARTMVMFEDKALSDPNALVNGLKAHTYDVPAGETKETRKVVFTPPEGPWESVTVKFRTFSHCLDGVDCDEQNVRDVTWTFQNQSPDSIPPTTTEDAKAAPGATGLWVVLVVVVAALARRR